jgi:AraC-like DNA-binding protein
MKFKKPEMTYYHQQLISIKENCLPKDHLCEQVIQAKEFIDHHFENDIQLADIAAKAYCSKFHFLRLFKKLYGKTPHQYLTEVRIKKASNY